MPLPFADTNQMVLYADDGYDSHVVRILLAEKHQPFHLAILASERPEDLRQLNPYNTLPVLSHQNVNLFEINVIFEYLEERYRGHKLLPESPTLRATHRQLAWRIQNDWLKLARQLLMHPDSFDKEQAKIARHDLQNALVTLSPLFSQYTYFMADDYGWCDVLLSAMLYRLPEMDIALPKHLCRPLIEYQNRVLERATFLETR